MQTITKYVHCVTVTTQSTTTTRMYYTNFSITIRLYKCMTISCTQILNDSHVMCDAAY